eukprot:5883108-Amphidinium_carterae.1
MQIVRLSIELEHRGRFMGQGPTLWSFRTSSFCFYPPLYSQGAHALDGVLIHGTAGRRPHGLAPLPKETHGSIGNCNLRVSKERSAHAPALQCGTPLDIATPLHSTVLD